MADKILELSTLIDRPIIVIDGERYEIRSPEELSVLDHHRLTKQGKALDVLMAGEDLSIPQHRELESLLASISDFIMVGVPEDVRLKLTDTQRMDVAEVFIALPLRKHLANLSAMLEKMGEGESTGEKSPHGFNDSTAATPTGGSGALQ